MYLCCSCQQKWPTLARFGVLAPGLAGRREAQKSIRYLIFDTATSHAVLVTPRGSDLQASLWNNDLPDFDESTDRVAVPLSTMMFARSLLDNEHFLPAAQQAARAGHHQSPPASAVGFHVQKEKRKRRGGGSMASRSVGFAHNMHIFGTIGGAEVLPPSFKSADFEAMAGDEDGIKRRRW